MCFSHFIKFLTLPKPLLHTQELNWYEHWHSFQKKILGNENCSLFLLWHKSFNDFMVNMSRLIGLIVQYRNAYVNWHNNWQCVFIHGRLNSPPYFDFIINYYIFPEFKPLTQKTIREKNMQKKKVALHVERPWFANLVILVNKKKRVLCL